jgi:hypothetical protein
MNSVIEPIITPMDVIVRDGTVFHISGDLNGPMVTSTGNIYVEGTIYLDVADMDSTTFSIFLFSQAPLGDRPSLVLLGTDICRTAEWGQAGSLYIMNTCTTDASIRTVVF